LPDIEGDKPAKKNFKAYPIGFFHIDIAEVRTEEGKLYLFVAIDRTSKFALVWLEDAATVHSASTFLKALIEAVPYKIRTVLTDNGVQFCDQPSRRNGPTALDSIVADPKQPRLRVMRIGRQNRGRNEGERGAS
jgi:transposase InsO family protein